MSRYQITVSQPIAGVARLIEQSIRSTGSHFATHAEWRRKDGVAIGTLSVEADDERLALALVPPCMRSGACVNRLEAPAMMRLSWPNASCDIAA